MAISWVVIEISVFKNISQKIKYLHLLPPISATENDICIFIMASDRVFNSVLKSLENKMLVDQCNYTAI